MQIETTQKSSALNEAIVQRIRPFHWLLASFASGNLADGMSLAFLPLVASSISATPLELSWVDGMRQLPLLFFALPAGLLLDRSNRQRYVFNLNLVRGLLLVLLGIAISTNYLTILGLITFAFAIGSIEVVHDLAASSMLPEVVDKHELAQKNGLLSSTETTANYFLGRSLGSSAAVFASTSVASLITGMLYVLAGLLIWPIAQSRHNVDELSTPPKRSLRTELKEGFTYVWNDRFLRTLAVMGICGNVGFGAVFATLILFATKVANAPEWSFGLIQASFAIGSIILGLQAAEIIRRFGEWRTLCVCAAIIPLCMLATPLLPFVTTIALTFLLNGGAAVVWNTISISYRQRTTPSHILTRATSVFRLISWGAMPIGSFVGGLIADRWGLSSPYYFAAGIASINFPLAIWLAKSKGSN